MNNTILTGLSFKYKKNIIWTFGDLINKGTFGSIYTENSESETQLLIKTGKEAVFFEIAVLRKLASKYDNNIPVMIDSGKLLSLGLKDDYFIVMPNYGKSLDSMIFVDTIEDGATVGINPLSSQLLNSMVINMLFALDYINSKKYMHLDVNPKNIIFDDNNNNWYLIDFGLAKNFRDDKFEKDKKYMNHGTDLYMARDAHRGIMSRKCDLESLIYTMLVSEGIDLPWKKTKNKKTLLIEKNLFFKESVNKLQIPEYQKKFIAAVDFLTPTVDPDYQTFQSFFISKISQNKRDFLIIKTMSNLNIC